MLSKLMAGVMAGLIAGVVFGMMMQMMTAPTPDGGSMPMINMVAMVVVVLQRLKMGAEVLGQFCL